MFGTRHKSEDITPATTSTAAAVLAYDKRMTIARQKMRELEQALNRHERLVKRGADFGDVATLSRIEQHLDCSLRALVNR